FGAPCNPPPWGSLTAVDLRSGEVRWRVPIGTPRDKAPWPIWWLYSDLGAPSFGGGLLTASGIYFSGASTEPAFWACDADTGAEIGKTRLPANANAVPMSFRLRPDSRQFVVVAAGGNPITKIGDSLIAWALPEGALPLLDRDGVHRRADGARQVQRLRREGELRAPIGRAVRPDLPHPPDPAP